MVSSAQSELGRPDLARATLEAARPLVVTEGDRFGYAAEDLSLALWGERTRSGPGRWSTGCAPSSPTSSANYLLAAEAVVRLFTGGCVEVIDLAQRILAADPDPHQRVRALTCLTGALAFADRGRAGHRRRASSCSTRCRRPGCRRPGPGLAYALVAVTGVFYGVEYRLPRPVGMSGRWPGEPERLEPQAARAAASAADPDADPSMDLGWPFLVGLKRHFAGDLAGAVGALREAYVQQQAGEGLFRSEATAELVIVLAELGEVDEAVAIMRDHPPDEVAIIPGLRPWAQSAVEAATGHHAGPPVRRSRQPRRPPGKARPRWR